MNSSDICGQRRLQSREIVDKGEEQSKRRLRLRFRPTFQNRMGKPIDIEQLKKDCGNSLSDKGVAVCYLFGSYAGGKPGKLSDIDIAVLFDSSVPSNEYIDRILDITELFQHLLGDEAIDAGLLNSSSVDFSYEVIRSGVVLFKSSDEKRVEFEVRVISKYLDMSKMREEYFKALRSLTKEGKLGVKSA